MPALPQTWAAVRPTFPCLRGPAAPRLPFPNASLSGAPPAMKLALINDIIQGFGTATALCVVVAIPLENVFITYHRVPPALGCTTCGREPWIQFSPFTCENLGTDPCPRGRGGKPGLSLDLCGPSRWDFLPITEAKSSGVELPAAMKVAPATSSLRWSFWNRRDLRHSGCDGGTPGSQCPPTPCQARASGHSMGRSARVPCPPPPPQSPLLSLHAPEVTFLGGEPAVPPGTSVRAWPPVTPTQV